MYMPATRIPVIVVRVRLCVCKCVCAVLWGSVERFYNILWHCVLHAKRVLRTQQHCEQIEGKKAISECECEWESGSKYCVAATSCKCNFHILKHAKRSSFNC